MVAFVAGIFFRGLYRFTLLHKGESFYPQKPSYIQSYDEFLLTDNNIIWNTSYVIHNDPTLFPGGFENTIIQRSQLEGTCYGQALVALQNLLQKMVLSVCEMLDMKEMILKTHDFFRLILYCFWREGSSAYALLPSVLKDGSDIFPVSVLNVTIDLLKKKGPILISGFQVGSFFAQHIPGILFNDSLYETDNLGFHSMILIGIRKDSQNRTYFLLQNWWRQMQFVEVSLNYLKRSRALLFYVDTPQDQTLSGFKTVPSSFAECSIDMPETLISENGFGAA